MFRGMTTKMTALPVFPGRGGVSGKKHTDVLGGAKRSGHHKPRGFMPDWRPHAGTRKLLDDVQHVLDDYQAYLPMTVRQVFYRLIGAYGYAKDESAYSILSETLNIVRRAGIIPWEAIRDDGGQYSMSALGYADAEQFMRSLRRQAEHFRLDHQRDQETSWSWPARPRAWCRSCRASPTNTVCR
jgi:hypothetical protein